MLSRERASFAQLSCLAVVLLPLAAPARAGEVTVVADVAYVTGKGADAERHKLDLYLPKGGKDFPVVAFLHGGGYRRGDRTKVADFGKALAAEGVGVAAVGYRLYPNVKHPEQIGDVARAFAWLKANVAKHGGSGDKLFIAGHSAGGHLATMLGSNPAYLKAEKLELKAVRGVIAMEGYYTPTAKDVFGDEKGLKEATPATHASEKMPPFLLLYSDGAGERAEKLAQGLAKAIQGARGQAEAKLHKDRTHGTLLSKVSGDEPAGQAILAFVKKHAK